MKIDGLGRLNLQSLTISFVNRFRICPTFESILVYQNKCLILPETRCTRITWLVWTGITDASLLNFFVRWVLWDIEEKTLWIKRIKFENKMSKISTFKYQFSPSMSCPKVQILPDLCAVVVSSQCSKKSKKNQLDWKDADD